MRVYVTELLSLFEADYFLAEHPNWRASTLEERDDEDRELNEENEEAIGLSTCGPIHNCPLKNARSATTSSHMTTRSERHISAQAGTGMNVCCDYSRTD